MNVHAAFENLVRWIVKMNPNFASPKTKKKNAKRKELYDVL